MKAPKLYKLPAEARFQPITHNTEADEIHIMWLSNGPEGWTSMSMNREQARDLLRCLAEAASAGTLGSEPKVTA
jgi:hypothetical protein